MHSSRDRTVIAITTCEMVAFESMDYSTCLNFRSNRISDEDIYLFLKQVPIFKLWGYSELSRLTSSLVQRAHGKDEVLLKKGDVSVALVFLYSGQIDTVGRRGNHLSTLLRGAYYGESCIVDFFLRPHEKRKPERNTFIAQNKLKVLMLESHHWHQLEYCKHACGILHASYLTIASTVNTAEEVCAGFASKAEWRKQMNHTSMLPKLASPHSSAYPFDELHEKPPVTAKPLPSIEEIPNILGSDFDYDPLLLVSVRKSRSKMSELKRNIKIRRTRQKASSIQKASRDLSEINYEDSGAMPGSPHSHGSMSYSIDVSQFNLFLIIA